MPKPTQPPALTEGYKANFETLKQAFAAGDVCLVSATEAATGEPRALVCAMNIDPHSGETQLAPLAVLVWNNPYELFEDPTLENLHV